MVKKSLEVICVVLLGALVAVPSLQIVMRYVFNAPMVGAEEFTRFLLICSVFVSYPLVVEKGENIVMAELREALPALLQRVLNLLILVSATAVCTLVAVVVLVNISDNLKNATPTLKIPFWIFLGATFFGFAGAAVVHLLHLLGYPGKSAGEAQN